MNDEFSERLDEILVTREIAAELRRQEPEEAAEMETLLHTATTLRAAAPVEWPVRGERAADRRQFMAQVERLPAPSSRETPAWMPVWLTAAWLWISRVNIFTRKERHPMMTLAKFAFAFLAVFGVAGGTTVIASADSLPDSMLYPVKLAVEDTRLALSDNGAAEAELNLVLAQRRFQEMEQLMAEGEAPTEAVMQRMQRHLRDAAQLAASVPEDELPGVLTRLRDRVQTQSMTMDRIQAGDPTQDALGEAWQYMHQFGMELEQGAREPQQFQLRHANGQLPENWPCGDAECEPAGEQYQYGPGPQSGPGEPGGNPDCQGDECGPAGEQYQYGPGAGAGPGESGGNPDCQGDECGPAGDQYQYGPGAGAGPGEPGGNPDCQGDECLPNGEQNGPGPGAGPGEPAGEPGGGNGNGSGGGN